MKLGTEYLAFNESGFRLANHRIPDWCEWPPPELLLVVRAGTEIVGYGTETQRDALAPFAVSFGTVVERFKRVTCSEVGDDEAAEYSHVVRGALYVPEDEEWDGRS